MRMNLWIIRLQLFIYGCILAVQIGQFLVYENWITFYDWILFKLLTEKFVFLLHLSVEKNLISGSK